MEHQSWDGWGRYSALNAPKKDVVRTFPLHQIYLEDGIFKQTRSGPNWQGGILTLTTCKHYMRTANLDWEGMWLAGFTPKVGCNENYLLFLAKIAHVFNSNYDLGEWMRARFIETYKRKRALEHKFGDIYVPKGLLTERTKYNPRYYKTPHGHVRMEMDKKWGVPKWQKDIDYESNGRRPRTFVFTDVKLFKKPTWVSTRPLHRSGYKGTIADLQRGVERV